jgi:hypothetical protein
VHPHASGSDVYCPRSTKHLGLFNRRCMLCAVVNLGTHLQRCAFRFSHGRWRPSNCSQQVPVVGTQVFFVVSRSHFIEDIAKLHVKGYDASGKDDAELEEDEDFSDDEKARVGSSHVGAGRWLNHPRTRDAGGRSSSSKEEAPGARRGCIGGVCGRERSSQCAEAKCIEAEERRPWPCAAAVAAHARAATWHAGSRPSWYAAPRNGLRQPVSDSLRPDGGDALAWICAGAGAFPTWCLGGAVGLDAGMASAVSWRWALGLSTTAATVMSMQRVQMSPAPCCDSPASSIQQCRAWVVETRRYERPKSCPPEP